MFTTRKISTAIAIGTLGLFWASLASAVPPASVAGTWSIIGNNHVQTLTLVQDPSNPVNAACKPIRGTLTNANTNVRGYYCPSTGRIAFARKQLVTNTVNQMWVGNLSEVALNNPLRMAGTFHNVDIAAGGGALLGEFQFQGNKVR